MTIKEAIDTGKPFRRETWRMHGEYRNWLMVDTAGYIVAREFPNNEFSLSVGSIFADDWETLEANATKSNAECPPRQVETLDKGGNLPNGLRLTCGRR